MAEQSRHEQIQARLDAYYKAEAAILASQSYTIEGLTLTRADLATVQNMIEKLENEIAQLDTKKWRRARARVIVPGW